MEENFQKNEVVVPDSVLEEAEKAVGKLVPQKSKDLYEKEYNIFCRWRDQKQAKGVDENIVLAYISERSTKVKSSSLWSYYSQLKKMLSVREKVDCSRFHQVTAFLKTASTGYVPKKSRVFTREDLEKFLDTAPNETYLLLKVVAIMGIAGGCRIGELVSMSVDDIDDRGSVLVVQIPDTKTYKKRVFTVVNGGNSVNALDVFRKYRSLRPEKVSHKRLFVHFQNEKCTVQPVGLNTFSKIPQKIAKFLGLPNAEEYTGHSFRRSSATLLADSGADLSVLKRHGGWRSNSVAEGYVEDSLVNKINISKRILGEEVDAESGCFGEASSSIPREFSVTTSNKNHTSKTTISAENVSVPLNGGTHINFSGLTNCQFYFGCENKISKDNLQ